MDESQHWSSVDRGQEIQTHTRGGAILVAVLASFLASFGVLFSLWARFIRDYYFPSGDEFALLVNSTRLYKAAPSSWITQGFSEYFVVYPDVTASFTHFLRPVVNATYYINSIIFGQHWSWYLLTTYFIQSCIVAMVVYLAIKYCDLRLRAALLLGFVYFTYPAFGLEAILFPSFAFDLFASLLVVLGISQLLRGSFLGAWPLFLLAVFTKEPALFAPFAAAIAVYLYPGAVSRITKILKSCAFLSIYLIWGIVRYFAFVRGKSAKGFALGTPIGASLSTLIAGVLSWPSGVAVLHKNLRAVTPESFFFVALNGVFWVVVIIVLTRALSTNAQDARHDAGITTQARATLLLFAAGAIGLPMLLNLGVRFGAVFYPLFVLSMGFVIADAKSRVLRALALLVLLSPAALNAYHKTRSFHDYLAGARNSWAMSSSYIHELTNAKAPMVFTLDDMSGGYSSAYAIQTFSGYSGKLVRLDDALDPVWAPESSCQVRETGNQEHITGQTVKIESWIGPPCAGHTFNGAFELLSESSAHPIVRHVDGVTITYFFASPADMHALLIPGRMMVEIRHAPANSMLLAPNAARHSYDALTIP